MGTIESVQAAVAESQEEARTAAPLSGGTSLPCAARTRSDDWGVSEAQQNEVARLLSKHGVSTSSYGREGCLTVRDLAREVAQGFCKLEPDESGRLLRSLTLVEITLVVRITGGRLALIEEEQILDDGRKRRFPHRKLHGKLMKRESPVRGAWRCVRERLGLSATAAGVFRAALTVAQNVGEPGRTNEPLFEVGTVVEEADTFEAPSSSYPGLRTRYVVHRVEFQLPTLRTETGPGLPGLNSEPLTGWGPAPEAVPDDKLKLLLGELGLPSARSFQSVEGVLGAGNGGRVHLWKWVMHEAESIEEVEGDTFDEARDEFSSAWAATAHVESMSSASNRSVRGDDEVNHEDYDVDSASDVLREPAWSEEDAIGIEEAYRDLNLCVKLCQNQRVLLHERGGHMEQRLNMMEGIMRKVRDQLGNIEDLVRVKTKQLFGDGAGEPKRFLNRQLKHFIKCNFTDGQGGLDEASSTMSISPSGMSSNYRGLPSENDDGDSPEAGSRIDMKRMRLPLPGSEPHSGANSPDRSPSREAVQIVLLEADELVKTGSSQNWVLDILGIHERTHRRSLLALAEALLVPRSDVLGTSEKCMKSFVASVHNKYEEHQNPFHNEAHAAVVCHSTHWLCERSKSSSAIGKDLHLATDIAALAHDVGHFGRNNAFCTNAGHDLALTYNDRSVLENMHSATCFHLMKGFGCDVLASASREKRAQYREHIVGLILATDMATHFDFLGKFRVRRDCTEFNVQDNPEDRRLVTHCSLKAADLGHAALPFDMHERWAFRLLNEFYEQGDEERSLGVPVSPMCERSGNVQDFRESQKGFLQFVIMPLFKELATVTVPEVGETCLTRIECNAEEWIKGEPHEDLVQIIKAPPKQVKNTIFVPVSPKQRRRNKQVKDNSPQPGIDSITNQSLASASNLAPAPTEK